MDIEKLIEKLRTESLCADKASLEIMDLCMEAATAISTLQGENEKLRARINDLETQHRTEMCESGYDCIELGKLRAELEQMKREVRGNEHRAG